VKAPHRYPLLLIQHSGRHQPRRDPSQWLLSWAV